MDLQRILTEYDKMRQSIKSAEDQYLEMMYQYVKKYFQTIPKEQWSWETFSPSLEDLVYNSLIETYSITIKAVKTIYNIDFTEIIDEDSIKDLTYSEDGKTLSERLQNHYNTAIKRTNPADYFYNRLVLIMDTETLYASNHVIHGKLKKYATHVEVIGSPECSDEDEGLCEYYVSKGKMPIEELDELPPYHPDCECEIIYYIKNKEKKV